MEYRCVHGRHHFPVHYYHGAPGYYEKPAPEARREYLEDEKKILERRLKEIEARIAETNK